MYLIGRLGMIATLDDIEPDGFITAAELKLIELLGKREQQASQITLEKTEEDKNGGGSLLIVSRGNIKSARGRRGGWVWNIYLSGFDWIDHVDGGTGLDETQLNMAAVTRGAGIQFLFSFSFLMHTHNG